ncbi:MAG: serine carboxypeptidase [Pseudomonadales bacterium]|nr:serine carboxypeptidase [Pseudomonadales bacterium]
MLCNLGQGFAAEQETTEVAEIPEPTQFISEHSNRFNDSRIDYQAIAGETYLLDIDGKPKATIFTFAYLKTNLAVGEVRPVTFVWNGGPGSASVWLHMGSYGPKRIVVPSDGEHAGLPPYPILEAPETILDVTDLVFIDPVGTGFSRALGEHEGKEFWGLNEDADSMAEFIRTWVTEHNRWNSPKFLLGESFGTTRAAVVAQRMEGDMDISLNGILFISQALDYQGSTPYVRDNIVSYITYIPTMAATALYHGRVQPPPESQEVFIQQAREFAVNEYLPALFKGNTIEPDEYRAVRDRLAHFTGLSTEYIDRANLRVQGTRFAKELLRDQGLAVGRSDSRYTQDQIDDLAAENSRDPASDGISSAYKAALMTYMRNDLGVEWDRSYLSPADPDLGPNWRWRTVPDGTSWEPAYVNTAHELSQALRINPSLKVFVASGYFDLTTPFFDAEFTLNRHDIRADQIRYEFYQGGHMMYVNEPSRVLLLEDTREFILSQIPAR